MITDTIPSGASLYDLSTSLWLCPQGLPQKILTPAELALLNDTALESDPVDEELELLKEGYESRILSAVLSRLDAGTYLADVAGGNGSGQNH